ncbi:MAG: hypothetical protein M3R17_09285 [Bacteroidota bacterium]|nr:hypothetical protein [Bacteroidota bacterium]
MRKDFCVEKICNIPVDIKTSNKSPLALCMESKFGDFYLEISLHDIKTYLLSQSGLIEKWQIWTEDKRTWGYGLSINAGEYSIGYRDSNNILTFHKTFSNKLDACSEYIFREVASILNIEIPDSKFL